MISDYITEVREYKNGVHISTIHWKIEDWDLYTAWRTFPNSNTVNSVPEYDSYAELGVAAVILDTLRRNS